MSMIHAVLLVVGLLAAVVLLCVVVTGIEKKLQRTEYDERQKIVQGKAYALAFNAGLLYFIPITVWQMLQADAGKQFADMWLLLFLGLWIQMLLFNTYCIFNGAGLPLSGKHPWAAGVYVLLGIHYFLAFFGYGPELNRQEMSLAPLMMGVGFAYLGVLHLIQYFRDREE